MIELNFRIDKNRVPILSKSELEDIAEIILYDYDSRILEEPKILDVEDLAENYLGLDMDYQDLSHNQSILGMIVFNDCLTTVYDIKNSRLKYIEAKEGTIFIDNSLLNEEQARRGRFTLGHEIAHWILHKSKYSFNPNQLTFFDESPKQSKPIIKCRKHSIENTESFRRKLSSDEDWIEWQADYLSSTLLMPKVIFTKITNEKFVYKNIAKGYYEYGYDENLDLWIDILVSELADIFDVSYTAVKIRLKNLGLIRENSIEQQSFV